MKSYKLINYQAKIGELSILLQLELDYPSVRYGNCFLYK